MQVAGRLVAAAILPTDPADLLVKAESAVPAEWLEGYSPSTPPSRASYKREVRPSPTSSTGTPAAKGVCALAEEKPSVVSIAEEETDAVCPLEAVYPAWAVPSLSTAGALNMLTVAGPTCCRPAPCAHVAWRLRMGPCSAKLCLPAHS